jgi:hypothetical protein
VLYCILLSNTQNYITVIHTKVEMNSFKLFISSFDILNSTRSDTLLRFDGGCSESAATRRFFVPFDAGACLLYGIVLVNCFVNWFV